MSLKSLHINTVTVVTVFSQILHTLLFKEMPTKNWGGQFICTQTLLSFAI
jgi:hypothetical protein